MGLMQRLRDNMPAVIIFLIVMFVALIVFEWGDARRGAGSVHLGQGAVGEVNQREISSAVYNARVENLVERQRQQQPDAEVNDDQIRDAVFQQMVDEKLLEQMADELGVYISDDVLIESLHFDPPPALKQSFTDSSGVFREQEYFAFLDNPRGFLSSNENFPKDQIDKTVREITMLQEQVRLELLRTLVEAVVAGSAVPSPARALEAWQNQGTKASGSYLLIDAQSIPDTTIQVSDAEAKKYYEEHRDEFVQQASRELKYVQYTLAPSTEDSASVNRRMKNLNEELSGAATPAAKDSIFQRFSEQGGRGDYDGSEWVGLGNLSPELRNAVIGAKAGDVIGPLALGDRNVLLYVRDVQDSGEPMVRAQHILLRTDNGGNLDSVRRQAEEIAGRARGGASFEELAQQYSADGSAQRGGDLGYFKRSDMVTEFSDAAFAASPGSVVGPVKTQYGYHIIRVNDRSTKSYRLIDLRFDARPSTTTRNLLRRRAQEFQRQLAEQKGNIDSLAAREKLQIQESGPVDRTVPVAGSSRLSAFAYSGEQGDVSEVISLPNGSLIVAQISKVRRAGTMSFEDAREQAIARIRQQRKLDQIKGKAEQLRARLKAGDSLSVLLAIDSTLQIRPFTDVTPIGSFPGVGYEPALSAVVFDGKTGENSPAIRGERGYYIVRVDSVTRPTEGDFAKERETFLSRIVAERRQRQFQEWLARARERAIIEDYRFGQES